jgi:hypothetical protein
MKKILPMVPFFWSFALGASVLQGGVGGAYFGAWQPAQGVVSFPFAPGIGLHLKFGLEGRELRLPTKWRMGLGASLHPLSSVESGDLRLYNVTGMLWGEYAFLTREDIFFYFGVSAGPGAALFRNNITGESSNAVISTYGISVKGEIRYFFPSTFWLELKPNFFLEHTRAGISNTALIGIELNLGFSNEY